MRTNTQRRTSSFDATSCIRALRIFIIYCRQHTYCLLRIRHMAQHQITSSEATQAQHSGQGCATEPGPSEEAAEISRLRRANEDREARWQATLQVWDLEISEKEGVLQRLGQELKALVSIGVGVGEATGTTAQGNLTSRPPSPVHKPAEGTQVTRIPQDVARLDWLSAKAQKEEEIQCCAIELAEERERLLKTTKEMAAADAEDETAIETLLNEIRARERQLRSERQERFFAELRKPIQSARHRREWERKERLAGILAAKQQHKAFDEAMDWSRPLDGAHSGEYEYRPQTQRRRVSRILSCSHRGRWKEVEIRAACSGCQEMFAQLLECPGCAIKACSECRIRLQDAMNV